MIRSFAPATVANVAVGFDILGFAVPILGDIVNIEKIDSGVEIESISGIDNLPLEAEQNTAGYALISMIKDLDLDFGFRISIEKGIPLGSGLGGSAASAVAAVVAANELLPKKLPKSALFKYAVAGESVASGMHGDNVAPCLFGGFTACIAIDELEVIEFPVPDISCLLIHPHLIIKTKDARNIIKPTVPLKDHVKQSMMLTQFVSALYNNSPIPKMEDLLVEPQRAQLIPGFDMMKQTAIDGGATAFSISGAGPTVFAFGKEEDLKHIQEEVLKLDLPYKIDSWICKIDKKGAYIQ